MQHPKHIQKHVIHSSSSIREAMNQLNDLAINGVLFVINHKNELLGSLTDGDIRRGFLNGSLIDDSVSTIFYSKTRFLKQKEINHQLIKKYRALNLKIIPILNSSNKIVNVLNFNEKYTSLPIDAVIMAGGKGTRLLPLTKEIPKPLLNIGDKPVIDYVINRLFSFGIEDIIVSINHLGEQIKNHINKGPLNLKFIKEDFPMGTMGSVSLIKSFVNDYVIICNADLLTDVDYEDFFLDFIDSKADLSVLTIPYKTVIPYGVLENSNGFIKNFKEKPHYIHDVNGGIYLVKKELLNDIPHNVRFSASDFIDDLIQKKYRVRSYSHKGYWLDIGRPDDYKKAQTEINLFK